MSLLFFATLAAAFYAMSRVTLPTPQPLSQTSFVYDANGQLLTSYQLENRVSVPLSAVPQVLIDAVVSTEDRHFFTEGAVNPISMLRAFISDLRGNSLQGGSTITQQYVKQAYLTPQRTLTRKIKEAAIAVKLGHRDSKKTILDNYLNTIYFGRGAYGVQAASEAYFGKPVQQDGLREASLLAGLIREPDLADPAHDPALARQNQSDTLAAMVRDKKISPAQAGGVRAQAMSSYVLSPASAAAQGPAPVAGDAYYLTAVREELLAKFPASEVDGGGLRVYTTLDPNLQAKAYDSVYGSNPNHLDPSAGQPAGALVSVDDHGDVRAMVGGQGYQSTYQGSQVNLALGTAGGGSGRQAGSTFKAFMLAYLIKEGYSIYSTFPAPPEVVVPHGNTDGTPWDVKNFEGEAGSAATTVLDATAQSINTVYAQIVEKLGPQHLTDMAEAFGISPKEMPAPPGYPSEVLGTRDVSPLEMAAAYATLANHGVYTSPVLITKVTTASGKPLPWATPTTRQVLSQHEAAVETYVLEHVVLQGTGGAAGNLGTPIAGKTGTTENSADAWFIGYTPHLTTAVWMGYPTGNTPMTNLSHDGHFYTSVQGGGIPAQLWHTYMASVLTANPGAGGTFDPVYHFGGRTLAPPDPSTLGYPQGLGTTTTTTRPAGTTPTTLTTTPTTTATKPTTAPTTALTTPSTIPSPTTASPPSTAGRPAPTTTAG